MLSLPIMYLYNSNKNRPAWEGMGVKQTESMHGDNVNKVIVYNSQKLNLQHARIQSTYAYKAESMFYFIDHLLKSKYQNNMKKEKKLFSF